MDATQSRDAARRSDARWHGSAIDEWGPKPIRQSAPLIRFADRREPGPTPSPRLPGSQSLGPSSSGGSLSWALTGAAASQLRGLASGAPNLSPCVRPLPGDPGIHVRGGTAPRPRSRDRGSGLEPPSPPVWTVILGPAYLQNPAQKGRIFPVFWGLRCNVQGGWGGSAHYPDPTAQSVEPRFARRTTHRGDVRGAVPGRPGGLPGENRQKRKKNFFFFSSC